MYCANCGKELADGARFCTACGRRVVESNSAKAANPMAAENADEAIGKPSSRSFRDYVRNHPAFLAVFLIAVVAVVGGVSYFAFAQAHHSNAEVEMRGPVCESASASETEASSGMRLLTHAITYDERGELEYQSTRHRDERGAIVAREDAYVDGESWSVSCDFDEQGCQKTVRYSNGNVATCVDQLDDQGRLVERNIYSNGAWGGSTTFVYSSTGTLANVHSKNAAGKSEYAEYDDFGRLVASRSTDENGLRTELSVTWDQTSQGEGKSYGTVFKHDDGSVTSGHYVCESDDDGLFMRIYDSNGTLRAELEYVQIDNPYPSLAYEKNVSGVLVYD